MMVDLHAVADGFYENGQATWGLTIWDTELSPAWCRAGIAPVFVQDRAVAEFFAAYMAVKVAVARWQGSIQSLTIYTSCEAIVKWFGVGVVYEETPTGVLMIRGALNGLTEGVRVVISTTAGEAVLDAFNQQEQT